MTALLEVKNLGISFGGLRAVNNFEVSIKKEELERQRFSICSQEYTVRTPEK